MRTVLSKEQVAYEEGYAAYVNGMAQAANPYTSDPERKAWFDGWYRGRECGGNCDA